MRSIACLLLLVFVYEMCVMNDQWSVAAETKVFKWQCCRCYCCRHLHLRPHCDTSHSEIKRENKWMVRTKRLMNISDLFKLLTRVAWRFGLFR